MEPCMDPVLNDWSDYTGMVDWGVESWGWSLEAIPLGSADRNGCYINQNSPFGSYAEDGKYELRMEAKSNEDFGEDIFHLERYFIFPLFPTMVEKELFKLEWDIDYPIPCKEEIHGT